MGTVVSCLVLPVLQQGSSCARSSPSLGPAAGGASLSLESAQAAAWGALVSLPLVLLKAYLWSDHAKREFSWVEDWHKNQVGPEQRLIWPGHNIPACSGWQLLFPACSRSREGREQVQHGTGVEASRCLS